MEQTPIEQLIDIMKSGLEYIKDHDSKFYERQKVLYVVLLTEANKLLTAEKERDKQIADKAWDAALNRDTEERQYPYGKRTPFVFPHKEEYIKSLTN